jgi:hypothetical protein
MTDTIAESFCERCGTRYAFEQGSRSRRTRFGRVRVLTKGLTTFVSNDGMPLAEAMATARDDVERTELARQLDRFHQTFSFCLSCRQYTCGSCWNTAAGQCLTCAPDPSQEALPAPAVGPPLTPEAGMANGAELRLEASAWPEADLAPPMLARVTEPEPLAPPPAAGPELAAEAEPEPEPLAPPPAAGPELAAEAEALPTPRTAEAGELTADELSQVQLALAQARQPAEAAEPPRQPAEATALSPVTAPDTVPPPAAQPTEPLDPTVTARDRTRGLLGRFRPSRPAPAPVAPRSETTYEQAPSEPEVAATAAPSEPEAAPAAEPEIASPAGGDVATPPPGPPPEPRIDAVEQPMWQIVAPDAPLPPGSPTVPGSPPAGPPSWPEAPPRPAGSATTSPRSAADTAPWATRLAMSRPEPAGVWAASSREVLGGPARPGAAAAVQACVSCGLPLSATARFCRRCGSRQG